MTPSVRANQWCQHKLILVVRARLSARFCGEYEAMPARSGVVSDRVLSLVDWTMAVVSREMEAPVFTFDAGFPTGGIPIEPR